MALTSDESLLIQQLITGDKSSLEAIFMQHHGNLCRVAFRVVRDADDAKDVVQDVFFKLWRSRQSLDITTSLGGYLKRAVVNTALNRLEKSGRRLSIESVESEQLPVYNAPEFTEESLTEMASKAIGQLPPRTQQVFTLVRFEEMSYKEVSLAMGISEKAVEKEMMKALRLLRVSLKDKLILWILLILPLD